MTPLLAEPNLLYLLLIGSVWLIAIAVMVPGTGALEIFALVLSAVAILLLAQVPTNWIAVLVIVMGGLGYQLLPFFFENSRWLGYTSLALQVAGSLFLLPGGGPSLLVIVLVAGASLLYQHFVIEPAHRARELAPAMLADIPIVGAHGVAQSLIDPVGIVRVHGENWTARGDVPIENGEPVVVVEQEGLTLHVRPEKRKSMPVDEAEG